MKNEKIINYRDIGEVHYRKNGRARNIAIRINSQGEVRVTVPGWCSYHRAEQFVAEKQSWIIKKTHTVKSKKEEKLAWKAGEKIPILDGMIQLVNGSKAEFLEMQVGNDFIIELPLSYDPIVEEDRKNLEEYLGALGLRVAREHLPSILSDLSARYKFDYNRLTVRRMRSRWGSCSSTNNISLNSALVFLSPELIRYVCLHELVHTVHKNHSSRFWDALVEVLPDAISLRKKLRKHPIIA